MTSALFFAAILCRVNEQLPSEFARSFVQDVRKISIGGALPGPVMAFGTNAEVVAVAKTGNTTRPLVASAQYGKGRVVIVGHGVLLNNEAVATSILKWVNQSKKPVALFTDMMVKPAFGEPIRYRSLGNLKMAIERCGTIVIDQGLGGSNPDVIAQLDRFVQSGGGLVMGGPAWGWLQLNPGKTLSKDHGGQLLLSKMGLGFADGYVEPQSGQIQMQSAELANHVANAMAMVRSKRVLLEAKLVGETLESAMGSLTADSPVLSQLNSLLSIDQQSVRPTKANPISSEQFQLRLAAQYYDKTWRSLPPEQVKAHPASGDFPGPVSPSSRVDMTVPIGGKLRRWWSTGAYAAPGEVVTIRIPEELRTTAMNLRIGGHNDTLWHLDKWERFPSIALEVPIKGGVCKAANPFGGLIYLVCDRPIPMGSIELENVVAAPVYFLGKTSDNQWQKLRNSPAPWGEIVSNNCVVSVPSSVLRTLDNPKEVAQYWDEVVLQVETLYSVPIGSTEERYQVDRQISAGYMHSGYPIMTWEDVAAKFVDTKILRGKDGDTNWGFYHEIGHNFQRGPWTWDGWGETTNNLFSLFGCEFFNKDMTGGHGAMQPDQRATRMKTVLTNPGKEEYFHKDPWYGLTFLRAIREEFGWSPFQALFADFRDLPGDQQPRTEKAKHDEFLVRMSRILKRDLSRYFEVWGVKNSEEAKGKCGQYPQWMPK